ncbi:MAG: thioredoxin domain-containing protein, partial [Gemmatimonadota bacterium]|nr:thioredoxin domain-containing protein [Gemmatimonadota bacterium]
MPNRLANETSPYLLQHRDNPVDWYPWGEEALSRARDENRPILLSIGYAACHWCHVMAHESFENEETAELMNQLFVNIKVDREERPDLDSIYMQAVQALTGQGGWPMTVFLTPEGVPFFGGTYYPPADRQGMPSFRRVMQSVADAYTNRRDAITSTSEQLRQIYDIETPAKTEGALNAHTLELAYRSHAQRYDIRHGGFGGAPKFPPTMSLDFLLRYWKRTRTAYALEMVTETFRRMSRGGLYDQIGGGFHRYTVDGIWLVPHFEKMLYDNALLVRLGAHLWQATKDSEVRRVVNETLTWLKREMTSSEGGFYSSLDADSEGHEGTFYVWSEEELDSLLGDDSPLVKNYLGVTSQGNFEGKNIPNVAVDPGVTATRSGLGAEELSRRIETAKATLYAQRAKRIWPGRDEKILTSWNGLMLRGVATAARAFGDQELLRLALANGELLHREMVRDGRVMRSHKSGETRIPGFLEDYAALGLGFIALYEATFDDVWIERAMSITESMVRWFWDDSAGAFFDTASDAEPLITRPRDITDNAMPSGTSMAADLLLHLADLTNDSVMRERAMSVLDGAAPLLAKFPTGFGHLLGVADMAVHGAVEVAIVGDSASEGVNRLEREVASHYVPSLVLAGGGADSSDRMELLAGRTPRGGIPTAYVCRAYTCDEPATDTARLGQQLEAAGSARRASSSEG